MYELRKRRIARQGDVVIMDKGFYAYRDHVSKEYLDVQRLNGMHRYPLDIFSSKSLKEEERRFRNLKAKLMSLLRSWQEFKPVRAVIEDVFKLAKSFGLRRLHRYTRRSVLKFAALNVLLVGVVVALGFREKKVLQRLAEM